MSETFIVGKHKGKSWEEVCISQPDYLFELMKLPVMDVVPYLDFILYCMKKLKSHTTITEKSEDKSDIDITTYRNEAPSKLYVYFDGCSKGNPGRAGAGYVVYKGTSDDISGAMEIQTGTQYVGDDKTNNQAEYTALIMALSYLTSIDTTNVEVVIRGDSKLVIQLIKGESKVRSKVMKPLYTEAMRYIELLTERDNFTITFQHVLRQYNKRADALANEALR